MLEIQLNPTGASAANLPLQRVLMALFARSAAMGLLPGETVTRLDGPALARLLEELQRWKLLRSAAVTLSPLLRQRAAELDPATADRLAREVGLLLDSLDASPSPATEWTAMREVFDDTALGDLVGVAEASVRRYAAAARATPQPVAERLHWVALVVADLAGAYNAFGVRRWFERPRAQLGGRSPRQVLGKTWRSDDGKAMQVRTLAASLSGATAQAAA